MNTKEHQIFARFPKLRPALPVEYQKIYEEHYKKNRQGQTQATAISMRMERWLHQCVAADVVHSNTDSSTLEIGAGTLNQLPFEPSVHTYDVIEPFEALYTNSPYKNRVRHFYDYIDSIPNTQRYKRITSVATFEHITNLPQVVAKAALLLEKDGQIRVSIPNEGTLLWWLGTKVTGFEFRRTYGLDYQTLMQHEHVNIADEIETIIQYFFEDCHTQTYGIHKKLGFYRFIAARKPRLDDIRAFLKQKSTSVSQNVSYRNFNTPS